MLIQQLDDKKEEKRILELLEENSKTAKRNSITSLIVSIVALLISLGSFYYAYMDNVDDSKWIEMQKELLKKNIDEQSKTNTKLDSIENQILGFKKNISKVIIQNSTKQAK